MDDVLESMIKTNDVAKPSALSRKESLVLMVSEQLNQRSFVKESSRMIQEHSGSVDQDRSLGVSLRNTRGLSFAAARAVK